MTCPADLLAEQKNAIGNPVSAFSVNLVIISQYFRVQHYSFFPTALKSSVSAPFIFENARNRSFHPHSIFKTLKMAHFTRFHFSLGLKSLISSISNFRWASNHPFQPFSFFIGPQIAHFSRFRFQITRKDSQNSSISYHFAQELHKNLIFLSLFASYCHIFCIFASCLEETTILLKHHIIIVTN